MYVPVKGTAPLIVHRFSEKSRRAMLDAQQGKKAPKEVRNPEAEFAAAFYLLPDGSPGMPCSAFKAAVVSAGRLFGKSVPMTLIRQSVFVAGLLGSDGVMLTKIEGEPEMREDVVRIGNGGTDLRYRPMFREWSATLDITYLGAALSQESVLSLIDAGGSTCGIGEWRPERRGDFGTFRLDTDQKLAAVDGSVS
jgi:hypothetical protein